MNTSSSSNIASKSTTAVEQVRLPSFDEVMAELMLEMAIRDINRKTDARRQRRLRVTKDQAIG